MEKFDRKKDYCTLWIDGWWKRCCFGHDGDYEPLMWMLIMQPYNPFRILWAKIVADFRQMVCVYKSGYRWISWFVALGMFLAVSVFGWVALYVDVFRYWRK